MRIFSGALWNETNSFAPIATGIDAFIARGLFLGPRRPATICEEFALPETIRIRQAQEGYELIEGSCASAEPGGPILQNIYEKLRDNLLAEIEQANLSMGLDAILLSLHGAMISENCDDCEGDILARIRAIVGNDTKIGIVIDPHANLSNKMLESADIIAAFKEYPHTDFVEISNKVLDLMLATLRGEINPIKVVYDTGLLGIYHTKKPQIAPFVNEMREIENSGKALSVSFIQSFPWGDSHATGTKIMVITNNDNQQADYLAGYLAQKASALADFGMEKPQTLETAIKELPRDFTKPYIWAESADNPGGGGAGDSTHVLRELLAHNISPAAIGYIYDPQNVEKAFQIGVGNRHEFSIGGHFCEFSGEPFVIDAEVISIDYNAFQMFAGTKISLGRAALLRANNLDIIVATIRKQTLGPDLFLRMGVNLAKKRVIVVKSSRHYETEFSYLAERLVTLDTPGVLDLNLARLPYKYFDKSRILNPKSIGRQYPIYTTNFKYTDNMELQEQ